MPNGIFNNLFNNHVIANFPKMCDKKNVENQSILAKMDKTWRPNFISYQRSLRLVAR